MSDYWVKQADGIRLLTFDKYWSGVRDTMAEWRSRVDQRNLIEFDNKYRYACHQTDLIRSELNRRILQVHEAQERERQGSDQDTACQEKESHD